MRYLALVAALSTVLCAGTCAHFRDSPPTSPSASEMGRAAGGGGNGGRHASAAVPFVRSVGGFLRRGGGFGRPLAAFVFSIAVTNVMGAFIEEVS